MSPSPADLDTTFSMRGEGGESVAAEARLAVVHPPELAGWRLELADAPAVIGREQAEGVSAPLAHGTVLSADLQPKLLRALQEGEVLAVGATTGVAVDVRVVAATNRDLPDDVDAGRFRGDLYARLAMWELRVPPLRERRVDLFGWIERLHRAWRSARPGTAAVLPALLPDAVEAVLLHPWMDNLRGLDRLVHALATMSARGPLARRDLPSWLTAVPADPDPAEAAPAASLPVPSRDEFIAAHRELDGNVRALARRFNRDRRQIYRWIEAYSLPRRDP